MNVPKMNGTAAPRRRLLVACALVLGAACKKPPPAAPRDGADAFAESPFGAALVAHLADVPNPSGEGRKAFEDPSIAAQLGPAANGALTAVLDAVKSNATDPKAYFAAVEGLNGALVTAKVPVHVRGGARAAGAGAAFVDAQAYYVVARRTYTLAGEELRLVLGRRLDRGPALDSAYGKRDVEGAGFVSVDLAEREIADDLVHPLVAPGSLGTIGRAAVGPLDEDGALRRELGPVADGFAPLDEARRSAQVASGELARFHAPPLRGFRLPPGGRALVEGIHEGPPVAAAVTTVLTADARARAAGPALEGLVLRHAEDVARLFAGQVLEGRRPRKPNDPADLRFQLAVLRYLGSAPANDARPRQRLWSVLHLAWSPDPSPMPGAARTALGALVGSKLAANPAEATTAEGLRTIARWSPAELSRRALETYAAVGGAPLVPMNEAEGPAEAP